MSTTATYPTRAATVWDLLALGHAFLGQKVSVIAHNNNDGDIDFGLWSGSLDFSTTPPRIALTSEQNAVRYFDYDLTLDEHNTWILDLTQSQAKAGRHQVHTDLRGITLYGDNGAPWTTYRLTNSAPMPPYTPAQVRCESMYTYREVQTALAAHGYVGSARAFEIGMNELRLDPHDGNPHGFVVYCGVFDGPGEILGWLLTPTTLEGDYYATDPDNPRQVPLMLGLDATAEDVAVAVAAYLDTHAPYLRRHDLP